MMTGQFFTGLHHVALRCPDLARSVAFYQALGFRRVHEWALPEYEIDRAVMMQSPDRKSWIELFDLKAAIPMQGQGAQEGQGVVTGALAHICLIVSELDPASDAIVRAGARHLHGPETLGLGTPSVRARNAIFEGPAGERIELLEPLHFPGDHPDR